MAPLTQTHTYTNFRGGPAASMLLALAEMDKRNWNIWVLSLLHPLCPFQQLLSHFL